MLYITRLLEELWQCLDQGLVFYDFLWDTFDSLSFQLLLAKLSSYILQIEAVCLIYSYLSPIHQMWTKSVAAIAQNFPLGFLQGFNHVLKYLCDLFLLASNVWMVRSYFLYLRRNRSYAIHYCNGSITTVT